jgi:hypothetical protein
MYIPCQIQIANAGFISGNLVGENAVTSFLSGNNATPIIDTPLMREILEEGSCKYYSRASLLLCCAAEQCLPGKSGKELVLDETTGLYFGAEMQNMPECIIADKNIRDNGPNRLSPMMGPNLSVHSTCSQLAIRMGITGPNMTVSAGYCSSLQALVMACMHLELGFVARALVGTVELGYPISNLTEHIPGDHGKNCSELGLSVLLEKSNGTENGQVIKGLHAIRQTDESERETFIAQALVHFKMKMGIQTGIRRVIFSGGISLINREKLSVAATAAFGTDMPEFLFQETVTGHFESAGGLCGLLLLHASPAAVHGETVIICSADANGYLCMVGATAGRQTLK